MKILSAGNIKGIIGKEILVCKKTTPDNFEQILKSKAVIVEEGGLLSHASIICRELEIPCIQIKGATKSFKKGTEIVGLNWIYGEVLEDIDMFMKKYEDRDFKVTKDDEKVLDKIGNIMIDNINKCPILKGKEWKTWWKHILVAIKYFKQANTPASKMIGISIIEKIIRATTL